MLFLSIILLLIQSILSTAVQKIPIHESFTFDQQLNLWFYKLSFTIRQLNIYDMHLALD